MQLPSGRQALLLICVLLTAIFLVLLFRWPPQFVRQQRLPPLVPLSKAQGGGKVAVIQPEKPASPQQTSKSKQPAKPQTERTPQKPTALQQPSPYLTPLMTKKLDSPSWTLDTLRDLYFEEVLRVHRKCSKKVRVGRQGDGGWDICMDEGYVPRYPCLVYSFGVGSIWEFDEQMASKYNCTVRAFDPTMSKKEHVHKPGPVYFYPIGLGGNADTKKSGSGFLTLSLYNFFRKFKERQYVIDILKMDIEYYEWDALERIIKDGSLGQVKQLMLEYHTNEVKGRASDINNYRRYLKIMQTLEARGFRKYQATRNHGAVGVFRNALPYPERNKPRHRGRSCCYELYYINTAYRAGDKRQ